VVNGKDHDLIRSRFIEDCERELPPTLGDLNTEPIQARLAAAKSSGFMGLGVIITMVERREADSNVSGSD